MDRESRVKYFTQLTEKEGNAYSSMEVPYKGETKKLEVYEIDMQFLIYNKYNGRIASSVKSYERQKGELDPTRFEDIKTIEEFLWNSSVFDNKNTLKSLRENRQLKYGIVTKDGVIIDGNRRASLLRRLNADDKKNRHFKAVVLDETIDENPKEIMALETIYQMGEDAKVDYNAIEKYLKCKDLKNYNFTNEEIAKMMGEPAARIADYLSIMNLMDDYLGKLGYTGIYTRLDKTEGIFVDLDKYLQRYGFKYDEKEGRFNMEKGKQSKLVKWNYKERDLNDLKLIYFDFIRARYSGDGKDYRFIGQTSKRDSFFSNEEIWGKFRDYHFKNIDPVSEAEPTIDEIKAKNPNVDLGKLLKNRDEVWQKKVEHKIKENMGKSHYRLDLLNKTKEPKELLNRIWETMEKIDTDHEAFLEDSDVLDLVSRINSRIWEFKRLIKSHEKETSKS